MSHSRWRSREENARFDAVLAQYSDERFVVDEESFREATCRCLLAEVAILAAMLVLAAHHPEAPLLTECRQQPATV